MTVYAITSLSHARPAPPGLPTSSAGTGRSRTASSGSGSDLRRGQLPGAHRDRPMGHGLAAQPHHRRAQPSWAGQPRRRPTPPRPRPTSTARHPRDHPRMKRTSRENAGALGRTHADLISGGSAAAATRAPVGARPPWLPSLLTALCVVRAGYREHQCCWSTRRLIIPRFPLNRPGVGGKTIPLSPFGRRPRWWWALRAGPWLAE
jgi:hypothetical protein